MQIFILGPLPDKTHSGGVAIFTLNFALALQQLGYPVTVFTTGKLPHLPGITVRPIRELKAVWRQEHPQLLFSSLWYSLFGLRRFPGTRKIHLLHGFTNLNNYSWWRMGAMLGCDQLIRRHFDVILANSTFTALVNADLYHLRVDGTFQIGVADQNLNGLKRSTVIKTATVLYLGRLVAAKNVDLIIDCFEQAHLATAKLQLVGYGPLQAEVQRRIVKQPRIQLLGPVEPAKTAAFYLKAQVFISLNPVEPYGITYLEALVANDFIIAPNTGGQVAFLQQFPDRVALVDVSQPQQICAALVRGLASQLVDFKTRYDLSRLTYQHTAKELLRKGGVS